MGNLCLAWLGAVSVVRVHRLMAKSTSQLMLCSIFDPHQLGVLFQASFSAAKYFRRKQAAAGTRALPDAAEALKAKLHLPGPLEKLPTL